MLPEVTYDRSIRLYVHIVGIPGTRVPCGTHTKCEELVAGDIVRYFPKQSWPRLIDS